MGRRRAGGLGLLWNEEVEIQLLSYSINHIDVEVKDIFENKSWRFTGFYGNPEDDKKALSWNLLSILKNQSDLPWLCAGDFNEILMESEKMGGVGRRNQLIQNFRNILNFCNLHDLGFTRYPFTWSNGREGDDNIQERLDRYVASESWSSLYLKSKLSMRKNLSLIIAL